MSKSKTIYICTECGASAPKWQGQCPGCGVWNTLVETVAETASTSNSRFAALGAGLAQGGALGWLDWLLIALIPVAGMVLAMVTARISVMRALRQML